MSNIKVGDFVKFQTNGTTYYCIVNNIDRRWLTGKMWRDAARTQLFLDTGTWNISECELVAKPAKEPCGITKLYQKHGIE